MVILAAFLYMICYYRLTLEFTYVLLSSKELTVYTVILLVLLFNID